MQLTRSVALAATMALCAFGVSAQVNRPLPPSSYSSAKSVDNFVRPSLADQEKIVIDTVNNNRGPLGIGGGTGLAGMLAPYKGMQISCRTDPSYNPSIYAEYGYAYVDANGTPYVRWTGNLFDGSPDTGWVYGLGLRYGDSTVVINALGMTAVSGSIWGGGTCIAPWPLH